LGRKGEQKSLRSFFFHFLLFMMPQLSERIYATTIPSVKLLPIPPRHFGHVAVICSRGDNAHEARDVQVRARLQAL
jgi:hypothetical protein